MPPTYSDSFSIDGVGAISFAATVQGRGRTTEGSATKRQIAASDIEYIDLGGRKGTVLKLTLLLPNGAALFDPATNTGLERMIDQVGTLLWHEAEATAILHSISGGRWWQSDQQEATAEFWLIDITGGGSSPTAPVAHWVYGTDGLTVNVDANSSTTADGIADSVGVEFGDGAFVVLTGPYTLAALEVPIASHTYAAPGAYVVTVSVTRGSQTSPDESKIVTVTDV